MDASTPKKGLKYHKVSLARTTGQLIERTPWDRRSAEAPIALDLTASSNCELAWAAGFFDGEGCTLGSGGRFYPRISITQGGALARPPEVLERFRRAVGGVGYSAGPELDDSGRHKPRWVYLLHGATAVGAVIALLWPYLGEVKRQQADLVLTRYYAQSPYLRLPGVTRGRPLALKCKRGHDYSDSYWTGRGRNCGPCQAMARAAFRARQKAKLVST